MRRPSAAALLLAALALAACSRGDGPPVPTACSAGPAAVAAALRAAPRAVRLDGGTPISRCVARADSEAELQTVGVLLTGVAEDLEVRAGEDARAALQLGYLVGAARRGAPGESMVQTELVRRLERSAAGVGSGLGPTLAEGLRAGERTG